MVDFSYSISKTPVKDSSTFDYPEERLEDLIAAIQAQMKDVDKELDNL